MNRKILIGIVIFCIILSCLYVYSSVLSNFKKPLEIDGIAIQDCNEYFAMRITVSLPSKTQTLYNCHIEAQYLTQSGAWKTCSKNIGIVNYGDNIHESLQLDSDFKSGNPYLEPDGHYHGDIEPNVEVEAYGYLKP